MIKPEFWSDERIGECSASARLLFIGTWNFADDYGNLDRSPKQLKAQIFPYDLINCEALILELLERDLVSEYEVDGKKYLHINGFDKHQIIDRKSKARCPLAPTQRTLGESSASTRHKREPLKESKENVKEPSEPEPQSSIPDREINPVEVSVVICRELGFAGRDIRLLIEEQITNEIHRLPGTQPQQVGQAMADQWRLYQRSAEWKTQFKKSPKSFFSSPAWKDSPDQWERSIGKPAVSTQADRRERNRKNILAGIGLEDRDNADDCGGHTVEGDQPGRNKVVDRAAVPIPGRRD
jgi:hypothetical protein